MAVEHRTRLTSSDTDRRPFTLLIGRSVGGDPAPDSNPLVGNPAVEARPTLDKAIARPHHRVDHEHLPSPAPSAIGDPLAPAAAPVSPDVEGVSLGVQRLAKETCRVERPLPSAAGLCDPGVDVSFVEPLPNLIRVEAE
jgi:hypothetical protein